MKFMEMEDNKEYEARPSTCKYRKTEQLLQFRFDTNDRWKYVQTKTSCVATMDFTEVI